jgi:ABC-type amino acid transport/signal transduction systems, periplasmic component/domain
MMRTRWAPAMVLVLSLAACGVGGRSPSVADKETLVIGVKADQPGLGLKKPDGTFEGFDVDVAKYVATKLGAKNITFQAITSAQRETFLQQGRVDLIFATYSITAERKTKVTFGGPYYVAHQDTLVRAADTTINNVRDLKGRRLCQVAGSNSWRRVTEEKKIAASLVAAASYSACVGDLTSGTVDAVSTDDLILAGFAAQRGQAVRLVNAPISDERYGVGIRQGDVKGCEEINRAVTDLYLDGTAQALLKKWFGPTGLKVTTTVPQFDGCS